MIDIKAAPAGGPGPDGDEFDMDVFLYRQDALMNITA